MQKSQGHAGSYVSYTIKILGCILFINAHIQSLPRPKSLKMQNTTYSPYGSFL
jgi:hypothetical protein